MKGLAQLTLKQTNPSYWRTPVSSDSREKLDAGLHQHDIRKDHDTHTLSYWGTRSPLHRHSRVCGNPVIDVILAKASIQWNKFHPTGGQLI